MKVPFTNYNVSFNLFSSETKEQTTSYLHGMPWMPVSNNNDVRDARYVKREDVEIELPVKGGRSSAPESVGLLSLLYGEFAQVNPQFNVEYLKAMEYLAMYNADLSLAVENIVSLGSTDYTIHFEDSIKPEMAKEMSKLLKTKARKWYNFSEGINSLINDLLAQIAIGGVLSAEIVPDNGLTGVSKVVLVAPKGIRFVYDAETDRFTPHQQLTGQLNVKNVSGLRELNETTYKYFALRRFNENPYGIPPFLAALEGITIERDMICNMQNVIKKLGVLGFLSVLINKPTMLPNEGELAYQQRCLAYLNTVAPEVNKSMAKGFVVGFTGTHEFKMDGVLQNVQGAKDIVEMNNLNKFAGLKMDPLMMGRSYTTTETLGRVILAKLSTQVVAYQKIVAAFLRELFLMELVLAGYPVTTLDVEFDKPMIGDKAKDEEAFGLKIANQILLRNEGIIDQDTAAQALGFEKAAGDGPLYPPVPVDAGATGKDKKKTADPAGTKKTDPAANSKEEIVAMEVELGIDLPEYNYGTDSLCGCGSDHAPYSFGKKPKKISHYEDKYLKATQAKYSKAVEKISASVGDALGALGQSATLEQVTDTIFYQLYKGWKTEFTAKQKAIIKQNVKEAYVFFRKSKEAFPVDAKVPEATFGLVDTRTMTFFAEADELYLGKFITDSDTRKALTGFIKEEYVAKNIPLGSNEGLELFRQKFGKLFEGEEWKLDRIISTTVSKLRNYATVNYMTQAEVETFEVVGVKDSLQCSYCAALQGKQFSVTTAAEKAENLVKSDPTTLKYESPFITSVYKKSEDMKDLTAEQLQAAGIDLPPYHCNCRDVIIAVL